MKKLLIYYNFIVITFLVVVGFLTATNPMQLLAATLFFPLFVYFAVRVFPRRTKAVYLPTVEEKESLEPITKAEDKKVEKLKREGVDIDRRAFLKLIGTAGLSLFLFSMFTKKAEAAFFGSVPGPGTISLKDTAGNKIDPAEKYPTDGYNITDIDDATPAYYGFLNKSGAWFIQKEGASGDYRYVKGSSGYTTNWTNRASLTYDYFDNVF